jgi:hypothetical protein
MYLVFLCLYFLWLAVQNFLLPWSYRQRWFSVETVGVLMAAKEFLLAAGLLWLSRRAVERRGWLRLTSCDAFALGYCVVLCLYLVLAGWLPGGDVHWRCA